MMMKTDWQERRIIIRSVIVTNKYKTRHVNLLCGDLIIKLCKRRVCMCLSGGNGEERGGGEGGERE